MEKKLIQVIILIVIVLLAVAGLFYFLWTQENSPGKLDDFAKCINDKGAKFYGAFWCSHCQNQKKIFGSSKRHLPYIECSTSDSNGQMQICKDEQIKTYPTWKFADGSVTEGELGLKVLAEKTGCQLPQ